MLNRFPLFFEWTSCSVDGSRLDSPGDVSLPFVGLLGLLDTTM